MNVNLNPSIGQSTAGPLVNGTGQVKPAAENFDFAKSVIDSLNSVNEHQQQSNASIMDLLSGKNEDINSVVAAAAKADMSFKLLVGVRNKLVEAYKETMRMQI